MARITFYVGPEGSDAVEKAYRGINDNTIVVSQDSQRIAMFGQHYVETDYWNEREELVEAREALLQSTVVQVALKALDNRLDVIYIDSLCDWFKLNRLRNTFINWDVDVQVFGHNSTLNTLVDNVGPKYPRTIEHLKKTLRAVKGVSKAVRGDGFEVSKLRAIKDIEWAEVLSDAGHTAAIVIDLDSTVFMPTNRDVYDFSKVSTDTLNVEIVSLVQSILRTNSNYKLIVATGRPESAIEDSLQALCKADLCPSYWYFKPDEHKYLPGHVWKQQVLHELLEAKVYPIYVFEDSASTAAMYRRNNINVIQVDDNEHG